MLWGDLGLGYTWMMLYFVFIISDVMVVLYLLLGGSLHFANCDMHVLRLFAENRWTWEVDG